MLPATVFNIGTIIDQIAALVTKALPSDAERLQRLKNNSPWLYARALKHAAAERERELTQAAAYVKKHGITDMVKFATFVNQQGTAQQDSAFADLITEVNK